MAKNLAFLDPPSLKFHNRTDIKQHIQEVNSNTETFCPQCVFLGNLPINVGVDLFDSICKESKVAKKEKLELEKAKPWVGLGWSGNDLLAFKRIASYDFFNEFNGFCSNKIRKLEGHLYR